MKLYEFFVHVPETHVEQVKQAIFAAGAGKLGNYSCCAWQVKGEGQFCPDAGSNPYIGQQGRVEKVIEYRVHTICSKKCLHNVIDAMKKTHPYEMPAYGVVKLEESYNL